MKLHREEGLTDNNGKQGLWRYYANDILLYEVNYKNDKANGWYLAYHPNGALAIKTSCEAGIFNGRYEEYYETGMLKEISVYRDGKYEPYSFYTEDGQCLMANGTGKRLEPAGSTNSKLYEQYYRCGVFICERCISL